MLSRQAMLLRAARMAVPATRTAPAMVRTYAAAAAPVGKDSKPPIALFGVDGTYASALYTAAVKTNSLEATAKALNALTALLKKDAKLQAVLATPTLAPPDKATIVAELQKATGTTGQPTISNFLAALAENNRLGQLGGVMEKFAELMSAAHGEVEMVVTSAAPLDNRILNRLESAVAKSAFVGQGRKLKVTNKVEADILGGLIVEVGDRTIDLSVAGRVSKLNKLLTDNL